MNPIVSAAALFVAVSFLASPSVAFSSAWRLISSVKLTSFPGVKKRIAGTDESAIDRKISWETLAAKRWHPDKSGVLIEGESMPAMDLPIERGPTKIIKLRRGDAALFNYTVKGAIREGEGGAYETQMEKHGIISIELSGEGIAVEDLLTGEPLAGRARFVRKIAFSPWKSKTLPGDDESIIETAWSILP